MQHKFKLGDKVIVNTGGNDTVAIIDYPTIRTYKDGHPKDYIMNYGDDFAYLCRFTEDITKTWIGGAKFIEESFDEKDNTLCKNAQFVPSEYITIFS